MEQFIFTQAPQPKLDSILTATNDSITLFQPYSINLTNKQKEGGRFMSRGREGYARLTSAIANQNIQSLTRSDDPSELSGLLNYYASLQANRQAIMSLLEKVEETQLGAAADIMVLVDRYVDSLQIGRKDNAALDLAMQEIDEWNKRFANKTDEEIDAEEDEQTDTDTDTNIGDTTP